MLIRNGAKERLFASSKFRVPPSKIGGTLVFSQITTNYTALCPTELSFSIYLYSGGHKQLSFGGGEIGNNSLRLTVYCSKIYFG